MLFQSAVGDVSIQTPPAAAKVLLLALRADSHGPSPLLHFVNTNHFDPRSLAAYRAEIKRHFVQKGQDLISDSPQAVSVCIHCMKQVEA